MYSVFLPTKRSGNWLGAHQKFDKLAYRLVVPYIKSQQFPSLKSILHFEGYNGPDGLIHKSAGENEPRHYYDPIEDKGPVLEYIDLHYKELVKSLRKGDIVKAAFEASWLGHAITDGMTPAHHFPYVETVHHLHQLADHHVERYRDKLIIKGETGRETIKHTWKYVGGKGMLAMHMHFEAGVAATVSAYRFSDLSLPADQIRQARQLGFLKYFKEKAKQVARLSLYERFGKTGWTVGLARQIRHVLAPSISETVAIIWLLAYEDAFGLTTRRGKTPRKSLKVKFLSY